MAAEKKKPFILFRPCFVLFCLYIAAYCFLRHTGEIDVQAVSLPSPRGGQVFRVLGASPVLPLWRQQLWRALFSCPMVVEEEGRKAQKTLGLWYDEAQEVTATAKSFIDNNQQNRQTAQQRQQDLEFLMKPSQEQARLQGPEYSRNPQQQPPAQNLRPGERQVWPPSGNQGSQGKQR